MSGLADFQHEFAAMLLNPQALANRFGAGLAVYQNTVMTGLLDVLSANFPTVVRLVGADWFNAAALLYAREQLPDQPVLALYGAGFPAFLEHFRTAQQLPYLHDVARLDRLWSEVHFAADGECLSAAQLAGLSPMALSAMQLQLHPAARFTCCAHSAVTIWRANRPPAAAPEQLEVLDVDEAVLLVRPHGVVDVLPLSPAGYEFLRHIQSGSTLGAAASELLMHDASTDIASVLATLVSVGAFAAIR